MLSGFGRRAGRNLQTSLPLGGPKRETRSPSSALLPFLSLGRVALLK